MAPGPTAASSLPHGPSAAGSLITATSPRGQRLTASWWIRGRAAASRQGKPLAVRGQGLPRRLSPIPAEPAASRPGGNRTAAPAEAALSCAPGATRAEPSELLSPCRHLPPQARTGDTYALRLLRLVRTQRTAPPPRRQRGHGGRAPLSLPSLCPPHRAGLRCLPACQPAPGPRRRPAGRSWGRGGAGPGRRGRSPGRSVRNSKRYSSLSPGRRRFLRGYCAALEVERSRRRRAVALVCASASTPNGTFARR